MKKIISAVCIFAMSVISAVGTYAAVETSVSITKAEFSVNSADTVIKKKYLEISGGLSEKLKTEVACTVTDESGMLTDILQVQSDENGEFVFKSTFDKNDKKGKYKIAVSTKESQNTAVTEINYGGISSDADILSFGIDGQSGTIGGNTVDVKYSKYVDLRAATATFKTSDNAVVYVGDTVQISGTSKNDFTKTVRYKIVSEDKTNTKYYDISCTVPSSEGGNSGGSGGTGGGAKSSYIDYSQKNTDTEPEKHSFNDVTQEHWAFEYINELYDKKIISGDNNNCFNPEGYIKREEFVKMLVNAFGLKDTNGGENGFKDVDENMWYAEFIKIAADSGIVNGVSVDMFGIGENITREDMAVMIYRCAAQNSVSAGSEKFSDDGAISDYAKEAVYSMQQKGIINGVGDNRFAPKDFAQRSEAAKMICMIIR